MRLVAFLKRSRSTEYKPIVPIRKESTFEVITFIFAMFVFIMMSFGLPGLFVGLVVAGNYVLPAFGAEVAYAIVFICWVGFSLITCWFLKCMGDSGMQ